MEPPGRLFGQLSSDTWAPFVRIFGQLPSGSYSSTGNCEDSQRTSESDQSDWDSVNLTSDSPGKSALGLEA